MAMTNEERYIASCRTVGEADVRQKLNAGRFSERRTIWASSWLEQIDSGKTDATRAAEKLSRAPSSKTPNRFLLPAIVAVAIALLLAALLQYSKLI
jgi:hypothetical protein